jgi:hypothetical protein
MVVSQSRKRVEDIQYRYIVFFMKVLINFSEEQVDALDKIARHRKCPRMRIVQEAVGYYLSQQSLAKGESLTGFGAWKGKNVDGLQYQRKIRGEWEK